MGLKLKGLLDKLVRKNQFFIKGSKSRQGLHTLKRITRLIICTTALLQASACVHQATQPSKPEASIRYFELFEKNNPSHVVSVEYWQETPDFLYLYADLYLEKKHYEVAQFVKFDSEQRVIKTRHFLYYMGEQTVNGGIDVENGHVILKDKFHGFDRHIDIPFQGEILHPARLDKYMALHTDQELAAKKYGFVDWRSVKPFVDEFRVRRIDSGVYDMPMKKKVLMSLLTLKNEFSEMTIRFFDGSVTPDIVLAEKSREDLEKAPNFKFDFAASQKYFSLSEGF